MGIPLDVEMFSEGQVFALEQWRCWILGLENERQIVINPTAEELI